MEQCAMIRVSPAVTFFLVTYCFELLWLTKEIDVFVLCFSDVVWLHCVPHTELALDLLMLG